MCPQSVNASRRSYRWLSLGAIMLLIGQWGSGALTATVSGINEGQTAKVGQAAVPLGDFYPQQDVTFDLAQPFWNGQPFKVQHRRVKGRRLTIGTFHFTRVVIPSGVKIRFRGFDVVVF